MKSFIVSFIDSPRVTNAEFLASSLGAQCEVVWGMSASEVVRDPADDSVSLKIFGRSLTLGEIACAVSHHQAYLSALDGGTDGAVFIEDDAQLVSLDALHSACQWVSQLKHPAILSCYSEGFIKGAHVGLAGKHAVHRVICAPSGTVCYAANRAAIEFLARASRPPVWTVADWPVGFPKVRFYILADGAVAHGSADSLLAVTRPARGRHPRAVRSWTQPLQVCASSRSFVPLFVATLRPLMFAVARKLGRFSTHGETA